MDRKQLYHFKSTLLTLEGNDGLHSRSSPTWCQSETNPHDTILLVCSACLCKLYELYLEIHQSYRKCVAICSCAFFTSSKHMISKNLWMRCGSWPLSLKTTTTTTTTTYYCFKALVENMFYLSDAIQTGVCHAHHLSFTVHVRLGWCWYFRRFLKEWTLQMLFWSYYSLPVKQEWTFFY